MVINVFCTRAFIQTTSSFVFFITLPWQDLSKAGKLLKFTVSDRNNDQIFKSSKDCFQLVLKQSLMFICSTPYFAKHFAKYFKKYIAKYSKPYSWPKKLYQSITNLIVLVNIPTPGRVKYHIEKHLTPSYFCSWLQRDWSGFPLGGNWGDLPHYPKN